MLLIVDLISFVDTGLYNLLSEKLKEQQARDIANNILLLDRKFVIIIMLAIISI